MSRLVTAFKESKRLVAASIETVAPLVKQAMHDDPTTSILIFSDETGEQIDLDLRGSAEEIAARYSSTPNRKVGPGRPKLGVVAREITLLPRHWEWLNAQPGGASVTLRKLVEAASKLNSKSQRKSSQEASYRFIAVLAGNLDNFEEATRALYAGEQAKFRELISIWPMDIQIYALKLSQDAWVEPESTT